MKKFLALAIIILCAASAFAQESMSVYKSLFVYNFIKHIQWPTNSSSINIGVIGSAAELEAFEKMAKAKSNASQQIVIKKIEAEDGDIEGLHLVYFGAETNTRVLTDFSNRSKSKPIVLISEHDVWMEKGMSINFRLVENKLKFSINKHAFEKNGLRISNTLLSMAI